MKHVLAWILVLQLCFTIGSAGIFFWTYLPAWIVERSKRGLHVALMASGFSLLMTLLCLVLRRLLLYELVAPYELALLITGATLSDVGTVLILRSWRR